MSNETDQPTYTEEQAGDAEQLFKDLDLLFNLSNQDLRDLLQIGDIELQKLPLGAIEEKGHSWRKDFLHSLIRDASDLGDTAWDRGEAVIGSDVICTLTSSCYELEVQLAASKAEGRQARKAIRELQAMFTKDGKTLLNNDGTVNKVEVLGVLHCVRGFPTLHQELRDAQATVQSLKIDLKDAIEERNAAIKAFEADAKHIEKQAAEDRAESIGFEGDLREAQETVEALRQDNKNLETSLVSYKARCTDLEQESSQHSKQISDYSARIADLKNELTDAEARVDCLTTSLDVSDRARNEAIAAGEDFLSQIKKLETDLEGAQKRLALASPVVEEVEVLEVHSAPVKPAQHEPADPDANAAPRVTKHYVEELEKRISDLEAKAEVNKKSRLALLETIKRVDRRHGSRFDELAKSQNAAAKGLKIQIEEQERTRNKIKEVENHIEGLEAAVNEAKDVRVNHAKAIARIDKGTFKSVKELKDLAGKLESFQRRLAERIEIYALESVRHVTTATNKYGAFERRTNELEARQTELETGFKQLQDTYVGLQSFASKAGERIDAAEAGLPILREKISDLALLTDKRLNHLENTVGRYNATEMKIENLTKWLQKTDQAVTDLKDKVGDDYNPGTPLGYLRTVPGLIDACAGRVGELERQLRALELDSGED